MIGRTNTGGGGGGLSPNNAVIHVTAAAGSTITFSKGGVAVKELGPEKSHVNADDNTIADWYYSVSQNNYGTWTVTATRQESSLSDTVSVDSNKQYDIILSRFYIFAEGKGLVNDFDFGAYSPNAVTVSTNKIIWGNSAGVGNQLWFLPTVDLSRFSTLYLDLKCTNRYNTSYTARIGVGPDTPTGQNSPGTWSASTGSIYNTTRDIYSVDVSSVTSREYVKFAAYAVVGEIYNLWLE